MSAKPTRQILFSIPRGTSARDRRILRDTAAASDGCVEYSYDYLVVENNNLGLFFVNKLMRILRAKNRGNGIIAFWMERMRQSDLEEAIEREKRLDDRYPIRKPHANRKLRLRRMEGFRRT